MEAYQADSNGFFIGVVSRQKSPLEEGVYLIPYGAYTDAPPAFNVNEIPKRDGDSWAIVPDFSGKPFYHKSTRQIKLFNRGEPLDGSYTEIPPPEGVVAEFIGDEWIATLTEANPVPQSISPAQARLALIQAGLYQTVLDTVAVATDDVKVYWEYANAFERTNHILNSMASAIGITSEQLDDLFRVAINI